MCAIRPWSAMQPKVSNHRKSKRFVSATHPIVDLFSK